MVALTGLSGVGKSTLIAKIAAQVEFQHLQASSLIERGRETMLGQAVSQDRLRYSDLDENQQLLICGLEASIDPAFQLVVLDSHTLIERDADHFVVDPTVFAAVGIAAMIFLHEEPRKIEKRRSNDRSRVRPRKDITALAKIQTEAAAQAELICREVGVPLHIEMPSNVDGVVELLRRFRHSEGA
ncbi:adenylate kinase [Bradyrhizobium elkanii]|uniref:ATP-binding protein n=1 Tax=Bradyrhizobium TaxID=374 RepID=UPI00216784DA|nr:MULTISPECIES: ATP-binding protein [Bradyrhizobium]MCS3925299.1 adenylate kinase [Bradyrhizobium elkanii]MCS3974928.1 adenylate kinase [Bradyrhizobium japonicum]